MLHVTRSWCLKLRLLASCRRGVFCQLAWTRGASSTPPVLHRNFCSSSQNPHRWFCHASIAAHFTRSSSSAVEGADTPGEYEQGDQDVQPALEGGLESGLYIVGTPIGNLEDITYRAVRVLREASVIYAEDTRHTRKLLNHLSIRTPTYSLHEHNEKLKTNQVLGQLADGAAVALVSDAGMPAISDPGGDLIASAVAAGHRVIPIPGPSAVLAALVASGLPTEQFFFVGFLPAKREARKRALEAVLDIPATLVLYAPPHSLQAVLADAAEVLGATRKCVVARELTKIHEELWRSTLDEAASEFAQRTAKGEVTLVIEGASRVVAQVGSEEILERLRELKEQGLPLSQAAREIAGLLKVGRGKVYTLGLSVW